MSDWDRNTAGYTARTKRKGSRVWQSPPRPKPVTQRLRAVLEVQVDGGVHLLLDGRDEQRVPPRPVRLGEVDVEGGREARRGEQEGGVPDLGVVARVLGVVPRVVGVVPRVLGVVPRVPGVVHRVLGVVPRALGGGPQGTTGWSRGY